MRISDWSSDVCSSDLRSRRLRRRWLFVDHRTWRRRKLWRRCELRQDIRSRPYLCDGRCLPPAESDEIGRASCRERVCQYVEISVVAVSLKKKQRDDKGCSKRESGKRRERHKER